MATVSEKQPFLLREGGNVKGNRARRGIWRVGVPPRSVRRANGLVQIAMALKIPTPRKWKNCPLKVTESTHPGFAAAWITVR